MRRDGKIQRCWTTVRAENIQIEEPEINRTQLDKLKQITDVWKQNAPDWVCGGCANVSWELYILCQKIGWHWEIITGTARIKNRQFAHVWLQQKEWRYDPVAYAENYNVEHYQPDNQSQSEHIKTLSRHFGVAVDEITDPTEHIEQFHLNPQLTPQTETQNTMPTINTTPTAAPTGATTANPSEFHQAQPFEFEAKHNTNNPQKIRLRAEKTGDPGIYQEVSVTASKNGKCIGDVLVGLDEDGELRVTITANGEGDGDHIIAIFPQRAPENMVEDLD